MPGPRPSSAAPPSPPRQTSKGRPPRHPSGLQRSPEPLKQKGGRLLLGGPLQGPPRPNAWRPEPPAACQDEPSRAEGSPSAGPLEAQRLQESRAESHGAGWAGASGRPPPEQLEADTDRLRLVLGPEQAALSRLVARGCGGGSRALPHGSCAAPLRGGGKAGDAPGDARGWAAPGEREERGGAERVRAPRPPAPGRRAARRRQERRMALGRRGALCWTLLLLAAALLEPAGGKGGRGGARGAARGGRGSPRRSKAPSRYGSSGGSLRVAAAAAGGAAAGGAAAAAAARMRWGGEGGPGPEGLHAANGTGEGSYGPRAWTAAAAPLARPPALLLLCLAGRLAL
ncbi:shadow of prion protein [Paroedura picta]|uniref:shadow of prion protein n=1 Tax=Paroedura picta TaxID=143630 RepID=UPI004056B020